MKKYAIKYSTEGSKALMTKTVTASSSSQAKEQIQAKYTKKIVFHSVVEK